MKKKSKARTRKRRTVRAKNTNKGKKVKRKWWKKLLSFFLVCCCLGVFAVFAFCLYIMNSCGEFDPNALANQDQTIYL